MYEDVVPHAAAERHCRVPDVNDCLSRSTQQSIGRLLVARNYAEDTGRNAWEFAVTIGELRRDGVTENELRWLVCRGYVDHAEEVTTTGNERAFDHHVSLRFSKRSAFVITSAGATFSQEFLKGFVQCEVPAEVEANSLDSTMQRAKLPPAEDEHHGKNGNAHPKWDRDRRELRLGDKLVKVFKLPSPMQEAILMAFEEEHWRPRIDDPLPGHPDHLPKRRLHDTIKSLNRNQKNCLIRFMGDGTGEGIRWELVPSRNDAEYSNLRLQ
jgi:hypothetical protein